MAPSAMSEDGSDHDHQSSTKCLTIEASVLHGPRDIRLVSTSITQAQPLLPKTNNSQETRSISGPQAGELQMTIRSTGICGSDVSYYKKFANGDLCACSPLSLGHESSGVVVGIGADVKIFKLGDRVALEVGIPCGECGICRKGRYNLCKKMRFRSSAKSVPHFQGTLQQRINHPAIWCHKLPEYVSFDAAALLEPLSVAIHAVNRASPIPPGSTALVIGAGTVGLLTAVMARHSGCTTVTITDIDAGRVAYALEKGFATHGFVVPRPLQSSSSSSSVFNSGTSTPLSSGVMIPTSVIIDQTVQSQLDSAKTLAADIIIASQPSQSVETDEDVAFDLTFECTGNVSCTQTAIYATLPGGKVILVGMGTPIQTLPLSAAHLREVDILGVFRYANTYRAGIKLLGEGGLRVDLNALVTHRIKGLGNVEKAMELASKTVDNEGRLVLKVVVEA